MPALLGDTAYHPILDRQSRVESVAPLGLRRIGGDRVPGVPLAALAPPLATIKRPSGAEDKTSRGAFRSAPQSQFPLSLWPFVPPSCLRGEMLPGAQGR